MTFVAGNELMDIFRVLLACVCGVTAVYFGGQKAEEAVQTLATRPPYEPPTIVLDAGHGE